MPDISFLPFDFDPRGKRVLVRVGMDVVLDEEGDIIDDRRIRECVPTIEYLADAGAKVILLTKLGRPKGVEEKLRTDKVARRLSDIMKRPVAKVGECVGEPVKRAIDRMEPGDMLFLENVRFYPEESKNDEGFARKLAELADIYVNECFSVSHREEASLVAITRFLPSYGGLLLKKEMDALENCIRNPERPFVAILGGSKADKIHALRRLVEVADKVLVGGSLGLLLLRAKGLDIHNVKFDAEWAAGLDDDIKELLRSEKIILPVDMIAGREFNEHAVPRRLYVTQMYDGWTGLDIGRKTTEIFSEVLAGAKTVVWAGPLGCFEWDKFSCGTRSIAQLISGMDATSIIGGGETAFAIEKFGFSENISHISTGGGAFMTYITEGKLVAVEALKDSKRKWGI